MSELLPRMVLLVLSPLFFFLSDESIFMKLVQIDESHEDHEGESYRRDEVMLTSGDDPG